MFAFLGRNISWWRRLERRSKRCYKRHCGLCSGKFIFCSNSSSWIFSILVSMCVWDTSILKKSDFLESDHKRRKVIHHRSQSTRIQGSWPQLKYCRYRRVSPLFDRILAYLDFHCFRENVYETPYSLLDNLSPAYRQAFGNDLTNQLLKLQKLQEEAGNSD